MTSILSRRFRLPGLMRDLDNTPLGVQHSHDKVAVCPRAVDEAGHVAGDAGFGDGRPQRPLPERLLNVDDEKNTSHDDKHPAGTASRVRPDQVPDRTDPVTSWLSQTGEQEAWASPRPSTSWYWPTTVHDDRDRHDTPSDPTSGPGQTVIGIRARAAFHDPPDQVSGIPSRPGPPRVMPAHGINCRELTGIQARSLPAAPEQPDLHAATTE
jgi:hypothetical protein